MQSRQYAGAGLLALVLLWPTWSSAAQVGFVAGPMQAGEAAATSTPPAQDASTHNSPTETPSLGAALAQDALDDYRGGKEIVSNQAQTDGVVSNATALNVATGQNLISEGAFANASGLPIVIQNSGANVLIQNSTIVNVQFQ